MNSLFARSYLVVGPSRAPAVISLTKHEHEFYVERSTDSNPHRAATAVAIFGPGYTEAFAAFSVELMTVIGERYEGPYQREVRGLAACIVLNIPFQDFYEGRIGGGNKGGGEKVRQPRRPVRPQPGGAAVAIPVG